MLQDANANSALEQRRQAACARGVGVQTQVFTGKALNAELWDVTGRRLIDFGSGIAVLATGHRHPRIVAAVRQSSSTAFTTPVSRSRRTKATSRCASGSTR